MNGHGALARTAVIALFCLTAGSCAGLSNNAGLPNNLEESMLQTTPPPPEGKRLTELTAEAATTAKLTGTLQVSAMRPAHDSQLGDWMFCIMGSNPADPTKFGVLIGHDAVLAVRSSVLIDGCEKETYHPLETADKGKAKSTGKPGGPHAPPPPQPASHQTGAF
jgi:hypothetical protein